MGTHVDINTIRNALPSAQQFIYLNAGTYGPMTAACARAAIAWYNDDLLSGRLVPGRREQANTLKEGARAAIGRLIGAPPQDIALTHHTTEGMNIAVLGQQWEPGDEIVITDVEHGGAILPVRQAERRFGVKVRVASVGRKGGDVQGIIATQLTPRTRLVAMSHVSFSTGARFDLKPIADLCHARGIRVAVDGAQSAGCVSTDVREMGVDYYSLPGQKWLLGPSGSGALYVQPEWLDDTDPTVIGASCLASHEDMEDYQLWPDCRRFEGGSTADLAAIAGLKASLDWLLDEVGLDWAFRRANALTSLADQALRAVPDLEMITPEERANLLCFRLAGANPQSVADYLRSEGVLCRAVSDTACVRFAVGFYNTEEDLERAIALVKRAARLT